MIQFLGLDFSSDAACAVSLARDLTLTRSAVARIPGSRDEGDVTTVSPAEWARAGSFAIQELYRGLEVSDRKVWGIGLSGPSGWVALDLEYRPLGDLRLLDPERIAADIRRWCAAHPRLEKRVATVLSPKDYFRFVASGALAADATLASRQNLLRGRRSAWDTARVRAEGLSPSWLPPVFDSTMRTGSLTEEGLRQTGLPGGRLWLVAGALSECCSMVATSDLRERQLWAPRGAGRFFYAVLSGRESGAEVPAGFRRVRSALDSHDVLEYVPAAGEPASRDEGEERARAALAEAGLEVEAVEHGAGLAALGAAALAAVGSGLVRSWDAFYRGYPPAGR